jgi:hypothetical protein
VYGRIPAQLSVIKNNRPPHCGLFEVVDHHFAMARARFAAGQLGATPNIGLASLAAAYSSSAINLFISVSARIIASTQICSVFLTRKFGPIPVRIEPVPAAI